MSLRVLVVVRSDPLPTLACVPCASSPARHAYLARSLTAPTLPAHVESAIDLIVGINNFGTAPARSSPASRAIAASMATGAWPMPLRTDTAIACVCGGADTLRSTPANRRRRHRHQRHRGRGLAPAWCRGRASAPSGHACCGRGGLLPVLLAFPDPGRDLRVEPGHRRHDLGDGVCAHALQRCRLCAAWLTVVPSYCVSRFPSPWPTRPRSTCWAQR